MPNPARGFANRPDYRVDLVLEMRRVRVVLGGVTIADSTAALRGEETGHAAVYYVPEKNVRLGLMYRTDHHSGCPYKGEASYWTIEVPDGGEVRRSDNAVWSYPTPYDELAGIAHYYSFYPSRVDAIAVD